ncbi:Hsp70 nucleotide exchange factor Fes1 [Malassezia pachydermatis]|uniref:Nucleotide exchange factors-like protein n=1 Tax=Malassezia pachydermatis TaxID=77020 RepID=A0A0M8MPE1_9BASI|nr:nucleotide exchange factors-like protein [Malassezia pachydermatis]KOS15658.1 nucleotide exchange factors-like protein [Malassezia pachydermatis]
MSNRTADELLKWGLRNAPVSEDGSSSVAQVAADVAAGRRPDLADPGLYDAIMGKSEAQMMQEELSVAVDTTRTVEDRCTALDNFEMLIEQVDNANNMESMRMWPAVIALLRAAEPEIQMAAAWIVGTAVQNNDKAQAIALGHGVLHTLLPLLTAPRTDVRNKGVYALSAMLKHYAAAVQQFGEMDGWSKIRVALDTEHLGVRRKLVFLLNQLILQTHDEPAKAVPPPPPNNVHLPAPHEEVPATMRDGVTHPPVAQILVDTGLVSTILDSLAPVQTDPLPSIALCQGQPVRDDDDYLEKAVQVILTLLSQSPPPSPLPVEQLQQLAHLVSGTRATELGLDTQPLRAYLG